MPALNVTNEIFIAAPPAAVWDALTNPVQTKKYMFGCETVSDWQKGSPLTWEMMHEGKKFVAVKGTIQEIEPDSKLIYSTFDPHSAMADVPGNYLDVTYELEARDNGTQLRVTQGDFSKVADGERRYAEVHNNGDGWNPILVQIKNLLENK